jgi:hypothetical protein
MQCQLSEKIPATAYSEETELKCPNEAVHSVRVEHKTYGEGTTKVCGICYAILMDYLAKNAERDRLGIR